MVLTDAYLEFEIPLTYSQVDFHKISRFGNYSLANYPYCEDFYNAGRTDFGRSIETGRNLSSFLRLPLNCTVLDSSSGVILSASESGIIVTHRIINYQSCSNPAHISSLPGNLNERGLFEPGCLGNYKSIVERDYNAGIEDFVVHIQFFAIAPEAIRDGEDPNKFRGTGDQMEGDFVDSRGNSINSFSQSFNNYFNISWLLEQAGVELDQINNRTTEAPPSPNGITDQSYSTAVTYRRTGLTLLLIINIKDAESRIISWPQNYNVKRFDRLFEFEYQIHAFDDYETNFEEHIPIGGENGTYYRLEIRKNGIRIVVLGTGRIGVFSFQNTLVHIVSSLALFSLVVFVVDLVMLYTHPLSSLFRKAKRQRIGPELRNLLHFDKDFRTKTGRIMVNIVKTSIPDDYLQPGHFFRFKLRAVARNSDGHDFRTVSSQTRILGAGQDPVWKNGTVLGGVSVTDSVEIKLRWKPKRGSTWKSLGYATFNVKKYLKKHDPAERKGLEGFSKQFSLDLKSRRKAKWRGLPSDEQKVVYQDKGRIRLKVDFLASQLGANIHYFREMGETQVAASFEKVDRDLIRIVDRLEKIERMKRPKNPEKVDLIKSGEHILETPLSLGSAGEDEEGEYQKYEGRKSDPTARPIEQESEEETRTRESKKHAREPRYEGGALKSHFRGDQNPPDVERSADSKDKYARHGRPIQATAVRGAGGKSNSDPIRMREFRRRSRSPAGIRRPGSRAGFRGRSRFEKRGASGTSGVRSQVPRRGGPDRFRVRNTHGGINKEKKAAGFTSSESSD